jgi:hypothetical protein
MRLLFGRHVLEEHNVEALIKPLWPRLKEIKPDLENVAANPVLRDAIAKLCWQEMDDLLIGKEGFEPADTLLVLCQ